MELEIAEVVLTDRQLKDLVDDRKQVIQRADGLQRNGVGSAEAAAGCGQQERIFDGGDGYAAIIESCGEQSVIAPDRAGGSGRSPICVKNFADVIFLRNLHDVLQACGSRSEGPSMRTVWQ